jgi:copper(I)-binding protein
MKRHSITLWLGMLVPLVALALSPTPLTVMKPWARATAPGATIGVAYFEIVNAGPADTLTSVESPVADQVEMHNSSMKDGSMQMRPLSSVSIPANGRVRFASGGYHVMLIGLKQPLVAGQSFPLKLTFRVAGTINQQVIVKPIGATD